MLSYCLDRWLLSFSGHTVCQYMFLTYLHWLPVPERVKLSYVRWRTGVFTARHRLTSQTTYPSRLLMTTAVTFGLLTILLWWLRLPNARRSATVRFPWQLHVLGTVFHQSSEMCHHFCRYAEPPEDMAVWTDDGVTLTLPGFTSFRCFYLCKILMLCYSWLSHYNLCIVNNNNNNNNNNVGTFTHTTPMTKCSRSSICSSFQLSFSLRDLYYRGQK